MNNTNETRMCTIKTKTPEGKFYGKLYETENGGYIWREKEGNLPPPEIDTSLFNSNMGPYELQLQNKSRTSHKRYKFLKSKGYCTRCVRGKSVPGHTMCFECLEKQRIESAERYDFFKERHLCVRCRKRKAEPNATVCLECSIARMGEIYILTEKQKERKNELYKKRRESRKAENICVRCGKRPAVKGILCCIDCRIRDNRYNRNKKEYPNLSRNERPSYGMCYVCGEPVKEGKKLCEKHYISACDSIAYAATFVDRAKHYWRADNNIAFAKKTVQRDN